MQRTEARHRINLLVNQQDYQQFSNEISSLTLQDFDDAVKTVSADPSAKYNSTIHKLIAKVQSASANVQGTKAALMHRRNDIRAYMILNKLKT
jgi:TRAP-type mannitol/chloroaromatic compound transport system substrate-binding protein